MLSKKEKIIGSILCVISVVLLIASLCFTTVLFTTHGTTMNAEAAVENFYIMSSSATSLVEDPTIHDSLLDVLLRGMTFGFDSIGDGITYVFNNLFFDDLGNLSNFTYVIVFTLGIGIVLGFIKWLLSYILSLGGKD